MILCFSDLPTQIFHFPKKIIIIIMAAWVSVTLKCRGQVLQVRHVVQCARECSFSSLLPKIDSKYEVPMFISARTKALRTLIILNEIHDYFNEIHTFFFFFFPCLPCLIFLARI